MKDEPKYLLTESQMKKLIKVCSYLTIGYEVDLTPYLFKDGWVKCSEEEKQKRIQFARFILLNEGLRYTDEYMESEYKFFFTKIP